MQPVTRPQADGEPPRTGRRHYWPGAGIYKVAGIGPPLAQLGPGLGVEQEASADELVLRLSNSAAGHMLPTGDPERFILVEVSFLDRGGRRIGEPHRERIGQTWEWWPGLSRPPGAIQWILVAASHRISAEALEYHGLDGYPASRVTHRRHGDFPTGSGGG